MKIKKLLCLGLSFALFTLLSSCKNKAVDAWQKFMACGGTKCVAEAVAVKDAFLQDPKPLFEEFIKTDERGEDTYVGWVYLLRDSVLMNPSYGSVEDRTAMQQAIVAKAKEFEADPKYGDWAKSMLTELGSLTISANAAADDFTIIPGEKVGRITPQNCTKEGILAAYGNDAKLDSVYLSEGMFGEGVVIYPNDARKRVEIFWDKDWDPSRPSFMRIYGDSTGSDWKTVDGITIGTTMAAVEKINGKPFNISGFGWDYGGFVIDWNGGKFNTSVGLRFSPSDNAPTSEKIMGEGGHSTSEPEMIAANPEVQMMDFRFLANEKLPDCIMALVQADKESGKMNVFKMTVNGTDHYWLSSGAAAYDGVELIYDANCKEVCKTGGMRRPLDCMKIYEKGKRQLIWEEK